MVFDSHCYDEGSGRFRTSAGVLPGKSFQSLNLTRMASKYLTMNNYPEDFYGPEDGPHGRWIIKSYDDDPIFIGSDDDPGEVIS